MGPVDPQLARGREAFDRGAWNVSREALNAAERTEPLGGLDLWRLAIASYLVGEEGDFVRGLMAAHRAHAEAGEPAAAARCAFWLGFHLAERGEPAQATGWFGRATRLLELAGGDSAVRGYLLLPAARRQLAAGDYEACANTAREAVGIGQRHGERDLFALALHLRGRALLRGGRLEEGLGLLDEAMVGVANGELSPVVTGVLYCSVIGACREVHALGRAHEWTEALTDWCERQPDMVAYRGECRVYRAEMLQLHGEWSAALEEARRASQTFGPNTAVVGLAHYQQAEIHRLRGEYAAAEEAYRAASRAGREPLPGFALLRAAQGDMDAAAATLRRALAEASDPLRRARLLPALVQIAVDRGDLEQARLALDELAGIADRCTPGALDTLFAQAQGAVELAAGDPTAALAPLRRAWRDWEALAAPYEAAHSRMLLGFACRKLGDREAAELELSAAAAAFEELGAAPALERLRAHTHAERSRDSHGLTPREREVLALVATGRTNRTIGRDLSISEKTVARHVANIFGKLGLRSRSAATAYAYEHDLLE